MAGTTPDYPQYKNWVITENKVYNNNRELALHAHVNLEELCSFIFN